MEFLPKMHNINLVMRRPQVIPKWETFHEITDQFSSECQSHARQEKLRGRQVEGKGTTTTHPKLRT
jgi:hypothetical protein